MAPVHSLAQGLGGGVEESSCCVQCGDLSADNTFIEVFRPFEGPDLVIMRHDNGRKIQRHVPRSRFGNSAYLRLFLKPGMHTKPLTFDAEEICRRHLRGHCDKGAGCKFLHVCRQFWQGPVLTGPAALIAAVAQMNNQVNTPLASVPTPPHAAAGVQAAFFNPSQPLATHAQQTSQNSSPHNHTTPMATAVPLLPMNNLAPSQTPMPASQTHPRPNSQQSRFIPSAGDVAPFAPLTPNSGAPVLGNKGKHQNGKHQNNFNATPPQIQKPLGGVGSFGPGAGMVGEGNTMGFVNPNARMVPPQFAQFFGMLPDARNMSTQSAVASPSNSSLASPSFSPSHPLVVSPQLNTRPHNGKAASTRHDQNIILSGHKARNVPHHSLVPQSHSAPISPPSSSAAAAAAKVAAAAATNTASSPRPRPAGQFSSHQLHGQQFTPSPSAFSFTNNLQHPHPIIPTSSSLHQQYRPSPSSPPLQNSLVPTQPTQPSLRELLASLSPLTFPAMGESLSDSMSDASAPPNPPTGCRGVSCAHAHLPCGVELEPRPTRQPSARHFGQLPVILRLPIGRGAVPFDG